MHLGTLIKNEVVLTDINDVNFDDEYDVIVAGLGTGGADAALLSAELNLKTLGIEYMNGIGGTYTLGGVGGCFATTPGGDWIKRNEIAEELNKGEYYNNQKNSIPAILYMYELETQKTGLEVMYQTCVTGVYVENNVILGVRVCRNGQTFNFGSKTVIDCTGAAIVCRMSGCKLNYGRDFDQDQMSFSKVVRIENEKAVDRGNWTNAITMTKPSVYEYSDKLLTMSTLYPCLWEKRQERVFMEVNMPGHREEGHVITEETVSLADCIEHKKKHKVLFHAITPADLVRPDRDFSLESDSYINWRVLCGLVHFGYSAAIPLGSIIPKGFKGLLIACKSFGITHDAASGFRMVNIMKKLGEAAASVAYLSLKHNVSSKDVPYEELKEMLVSTGCYCEECDVGIVDLSAKKAENGINKPIVIPSIDEVVKSLKKHSIQDDDIIRSIITNKHEFWQEQDSMPLAYLSALLSQNLPSNEKAAFRDTLYTNMLVNKQYAGNFAIALALAGDERSAATMCGIITNPGNSNPDGCDPVIKDSFPNRIKAICLLGRMKYEDAVSPLIDILCDYAEEFTKDLPECNCFATRESYQYLALSYTVIALKNILTVHHDEAALKKIKTWSKKDFVIKSGTAARNLAEVLFAIAKSIK